MLDQATRLREIADRVSRRPSGAAPHIMTVASGKGGVGKSTIALNLAVLLAGHGNRTLLFDGDNNLGNIDVMIGVAPKVRLGSVLAGERDLAEVILPITSHLAIVPTESGRADYMRMTVEQQRELLRGVADLEQGFDFVVIDTAAGLGTDVVGFAVRAQETIVVTTPEPTAVMDAYALIKLITAADPMVPMKLIVNHVRHPQEGEETARKLQMAVRHFLHRHVHYLGSIPFDAHVSQAVVRQVALVNEFPLCSASRSLGRLAEILLEQAERMRGRRFEAA